MSTDLKLESIRFHDHENVSPFDKIRRARPDGSEYWTARAMMPLLGYEPRNWQRLLAAVNRAKLACGNSGQDIDQNFTYISEVTQARGPARVDVELSRYGCYLLAMNGDPAKDEVAAAQQYFAMMTRAAELAAAAPARNDRRLTAIESAQSDTASQIRELLEDLDQMKRRLALVDARTSNAEDVLYGRTDFRTLRVWARERGIRLTPAESRKEGRICDNLAAIAGIKTAPYRRGDGKFVNMYSTKVLETWFDGYLRRQSERPSLFGALGASR